MRRSVLLVAIAAVALIAATGPVQASTFRVQRTDSNLDADTYVFRMASDESFTIHAGSTISLQAAYPSFREDASVAFAGTDLATIAFEEAHYLTIENDEETHIELLDETAVGQSFSSNTPDSAFATLGGDLIFLSSLTLPAGNWHFAVSMPGATAMDVELDLYLSENLTISDLGLAEAGHTWATEDYDGVAQASRADDVTAAAGVHAEGTAPPGTRGFAVQYPFTGHGAGRYGIDGPGTSDNTQTVLMTETGEPPAAHVFAGPSGTYDHWVDAEAWDQSTRDRPTGRAGVFFAAPMPLG